MAVTLVVAKGQGHNYRQGFFRCQELTPDEQVAFRLDFPVWLASWDERRRRLIEQMAHRGCRLRPLTDSSLLQQPGQLRLSMIGGLGSLQGALVGALIVSFVRTAGIQFFPEIELAVLYLIAVLVLLVKPTGLFGTA